MLRRTKAFTVTIWNRNPVSGTHNRIVGTGFTAELAEADFL